MGKFYVLKPPQNAQNTHTYTARRCTSTRVPWLSIRINIKRGKNDYCYYLSKTKQWCRTCMGKYLQWKTLLWNCFGKSLCRTTAQRNANNPKHSHVHDVSKRHFRHRHTQHTSTRYASTWNLETRTIQTMYVLCTTACEKECVVCNVYDMRDE